MFLKVGDVLDVLYARFGDFRKRGVPTAEERYIRIASLDINADGKIDESEFLLLLDMCRITVKEQVLVNMKSDRLGLFAYY